MGRKAKVVNEPFLERDIETGMVLNKDKSSFINAVQRKRIARQNREKKELQDFEFSEMKKKIESLEKIIKDFIEIKTQKP